MEDRKRDMLGCKNGRGNGLELPFIPGEAALGGVRGNVDGEGGVCPGKFSSD